MYSPACKKAAACSAGPQARPPHTPRPGRMAMEQQSNPDLADRIKLMSKRLIQPQSSIGVCACSPSSRRDTLMHFIIGIMATLGNNFEIKDA